MTVPPWRIGAAIALGATLLIAVFFATLAWLAGASTLTGGPAGVIALGVMMVAVRPSVALARLVLPRTTTPPPSATVASENAA